MGPKNILIVLLVSCLVAEIKAMFPGGGGIMAVWGPAEHGLRRLRWIRENRRRILAMDRCVDSWCVVFATPKTRREKKRITDEACHRAFEAFKEIFHSREQGICGRAYDAQCRLHNDQYQCTARHGNQVLSLQECVYSIPLEQPVHPPNQDILG
nr:PREDICTED: uncharacterized protein LOC109041247 [Bemisia tabaci]